MRRNEFKSNCLRAAKEGELSCMAKVLKSGNALVIGTIRNGK